MHGVQILKMKAIFQVDEEEKVFLAFVEDIVTRAEVRNPNEKKKKKYLKRTASKEKGQKVNELGIDMQLSLRKIHHGFEKLDKTSSPMAEKLYKLMTDYYSRLKTKLGIGAKEEESDCDERVLQNKRFRRFMKRRNNHYFKKKSMKLFSKIRTKTVSKTKQHKSKYMKTLDTFNKYQNTFDIASPYLQSTPQKGISDFKKQPGSRWSMRTTIKNISQLRKDDPSSEASPKSRLFDRPSSHLDKYRKIINNSDKASTKATTIHKENERGKSAYIRRKKIKPIVKPYDFPKRATMNQTFYKDESQELLNRTFNWKKVAHSKHIQNRIQKRIKYLVHVQKDEDQVIIKNSKL